MLFNALLLSHPFRLPAPHKRHRPLRALFRENVEGFYSLAANRRVKFSSIRCIQYIRWQTTVSRKKLLA